MLDLLRKKAQSPYIQATILIIIIVFIFWGVGNQNGGAANVAATVNEEPIPYKDYQNAYDRTVNQYRQQFGGTLPDGLLKSLNLPQQVLEQLLQRVLMQQGAREAGLTVSKAEIRKKIEEMESFRTDGIFSLDQYKAVLASSRMSPSEFEAGLGSDLLAGKIIDHLAGFSHVSPLEIKDRFTFNNEELYLDFVSFAAERFKDKVEINDEKLAAFFETNKEQYKTEPQYKINYISFPIVTPATNTLTEDQTAQDLLAEQNKSLTFNMANAAYEQIILAGSLEKYAAANNIEVLETDYFSKSNPSQDLVTMPSALKTTYTLGKGELSSLIEDGTGYSIIFVKDIKDPEIPPLESVKGKVIKDYSAEEAKNLARQAAETLLKTLRAGGEWQAEIAKLELAAEESGAVSRANRYSTKLPAQVINQAFGLSAKSPYPENVGEEGETFYVLHFKEKKEPSSDQFASEEETLKEQLKQEKQLQLLTAWVSRLRENAEITTNPLLFQQ